MARQHLAKEDHKHSNPLKAARERAGLTQEAAARALGVSVMTISRLERGVTETPSGPMYQALAKLYDTTVAALGGDAKLDNVSRGTSAAVAENGRAAYADLTDRQKVNRRIAEATEEFLRAGANDHEMAHLRDLLANPGNYLKGHAGWEEPKNAAEELIDLDAAIAAGWSYLRRSIERRKATPRTRGHDATEHD